jgi:hypothetical protein
MSANRDAAQARIVLISPGQAETAGHPAYSHWYLETMGVDPAAQRIGERFLEPVLEIADRARVDFYLEAADGPTSTSTSATASSSRPAPTSWSLTARPTLQCDGVRG